MPLTKLPPLNLRGTQPGGATVSAPAISDAIRRTFAESQKTQQALKYLTEEMASGRLPAGVMPQVARAANNMAKEGEAQLKVAAANMTLQAMPGAGERAAHAAVPAAGTMLNTWLMTDPDLDGDESISPKDLGQEELERLHAQSITNQRGLTYAPREMKTHFPEGQLEAQPEIQAPPISYAGAILRNRAIEQERARKIMEERVRAMAAPTPHLQTRSQQRLGEMVQAQKQEQAERDRVIAQASPQETSVESREARNQRLGQGNADMVYAPQKASTDDASRVQAGIGQLAAIAEMPPKKQQEAIQQMIEAMNKQKKLVEGVQ